MESKYIVSWDNVNSICDHLAAQIKATNQTFDAIVPIARGGLVAGTILSHRLGVTDVIPVAWQTRDAGRRDVDQLQRLLLKYQNILIVDDILDSGLCLLEIAMMVDTITIQDRAAVTYAVMFNNTASQVQESIEVTGNVIHSVGIDRNVDTRFVYFPWELID